MIIQKMQLLNIEKQKEMDHIDSLKNQYDEYCTMLDKKEQCELTRKNMEYIIIDTEMKRVVESTENKEIDYEKIREKAILDKQKEIEDIDMKEIGKKVDAEILSRKITCEELKKEIKIKTDSIERFEEDFETFEKDRVKSFENAIKHRKKYLELSHKFDQELSKDRQKQKHVYDICNWFKT